MRRLLLILILTLSFQSWTMADDIRDFKIEGISIGDSLLNFVSKKKIENKEKGFYPSSKNFYIIFAELKSFETYDKVVVTLKSNDKLYKIYGIGGAIDIYRNTKTCLSKQKEIKKDLINLFPNIKYIDSTFIYPQDATGESKATTTEFDFKKGALKVFCNDWGNTREIEKNSMDNVQVQLNSETLKVFINTKAYK